MWWHTVMCNVILFANVMAHRTVQCDGTPYCAMWYCLLTWWHTVLWHCFSTTNSWGKVPRCPAAPVTGPISAQGDATHHIDTPGRLTTHHSVARRSQYTDLCQVTVSLNLQVASSEQAMESRRLPLSQTCYNDARSSIQRARWTLFIAWSSLCT
jgi:hypothetical protein